MEKPKFNPDFIIDLMKAHYHLTEAFRIVGQVVGAASPRQKSIILEAIEGHMREELAGIRQALDPTLEAPPPERTFGASLDPDYTLAEEALQEAYELRDSLKAGKEGRDK